MNEDSQRASGIKNWLGEVAGADVLVAELLWHSVGRVLMTSSTGSITAAEAILDSAMQSLLYKEHVRHIADWLKVAVRDNASWLTKLDDLGRPKKLMKLNSIEAIVAEADKQMRRKQSGIAKSAVVDGEEEPHFDLGDGWSLVKLLSKAALERESKAMQHCIGHGAYDHYLDNEDALLLSLRDPYGKAHGTIEIVDGRLVQFQGKQNRPPIEAYVSKVVPYLSARKIHCERGNLVTDIHGVVYSMANLPEVLEVSGSVYFENTSKTPLALPREIRCDGSLRIHGNAFSNVPERISCADLRVSDAALAALPTYMAISGDIDLNGSQIATIPDNLWVRGCLNLRGTPVTALPRGLRVDGLLTVSETKIMEFPADIQVGGIAMRGTAVKRIDTAWWGAGQGEPRNLIASDSALEEIVGPPVFCFLDVAGTKLTKLPDGLQANQVDISCTSIAVVPADARISGDFKARDCQSIQIEVASVGGSVLLGDCRGSMPEDFECGGVFEVGSGFVGRLPSRLKARTVNHFSSEALPAFVEADTVVISGSTIKSLKGSLKARQLRVSREFEFFGDDVEVREVVVAEPFRVAARLSLDEAKKAISLHGNLTKDHNGMTTGVSWPNLLSGMPSGGKTVHASAMIAKQAVRHSRGRVVVLDTETVPDVPLTMLQRFGDYDGIERQLRRDAVHAARAQRELMDTPVRRTPILPLVFPLLPPTASRIEARAQENNADQEPEWWATMRADLVVAMQTSAPRPIIVGRPGQGKP
jgi:hypothetical protein